MRRGKPLSVRVRGPFRGLVTRLPEEAADLYKPNDYRRTFTFAKNVRFEDGVFRNCNGYAKVRINNSLLVDAISHWRMDEASGVRKDTQGTNDLTPTDDLGEDTGAVRQTPGKLAQAAISVIEGDQSQGGWLVSEQSDDLKVGGTLFSCTFTGWVKIPVGGVYFPIYATDDEDNRVFALSVEDGQPSKILIEGTTAPYELSGPAITANTWTFFAVRIDSATDEINIQIGATEVSDTWSSGTYGQRELSEGILQVLRPDVGGSGIAVDSLTYWRRFLTDAEVNSVYNSGNGLEFPFTGGAYTKFFQADLISDPNKPLIAGSENGLWNMERFYDDNGYAVTPTNLFTATTTDRDYPWHMQNFFDKVLIAQHDNEAQYLPPAGTATKDLPGLTVGDEKWDGVESFFGHALLWKEDRLKWSDVNDFSNYIPVATTAASFTLTIATGGYVQPAAGATVTVNVNEDPVALGVTVGQYVRVDDDRGVDGTFYNFYIVTARTTTTITLELQDLTGRTATALTIAAGQFIQSLDANEAGETRVTGSRSNGPIYRVIAEGDYAYIFKERSITSMQYVGVGSGIFATHPEVAGEGMITRDALASLNDGRMVFLGHGELYTYGGGPTLTPVCTQTTRRLYEELDRSRLYLVAVRHNENDNEVWVHYPVVGGGQKIMIWNYVEDTATIDEHDSRLGGFSETETVDWVVDPSWDSLSETLTWDDVDNALSWQDFEESVQERTFLMSSWSGELFVHGVGFNRDGEGYECRAETLEFDFDEPDIFKYIEVVAIGLQIKNKDTATRNIYISVGTRDTLDEDVRWTDPVAVPVQGNPSRKPAKVNPGGSGRFVRFRFYSTDADVEWRISSYESHARAGGFY